MIEKDMRFMSWLVSTTSILYGIVMIIRNYVYYDILVEYASSYQMFVLQNYIFSVLLIIFGILKIIFILKDNKYMRKISIVSLMFCWGFIETAFIIDWFVSGPNRESVLILPIIVACMFIANRGEYN